MTTQNAAKNKTHQVTSHPPPRIPRRRISRAYGPHPRIRSFFFHQQQQQLLLITPAVETRELAEVAAAAAAGSVAFSVPVGMAANRCQMGATVERLRVARNPPQRGPLATLGPRGAPGAPWGSRGHLRLGGTVAAPACATPVESRTHRPVHRLCLRRPPRKQTACEGPICRGRCQEQLQLLLLLLLKRVPPNCRRGPPPQPCPGDPQLPPLDLEAAPTQTLPLPPIGEREHRRCDSQTH